MSDRGDYRSFYSAFWDDPDVHALSHAAYRVLTTLKGTFPASGIGVVYFTVLSERTGMTRAELETALQELEHPKPNADFGWIVRERNIVWIVNGLRFEPTLSFTNSKHRTFLRDRLLAPLGERTAIVVAFKRYYHEWFEDAVPSPNSTNTPNKPGAVPAKTPVPSGTKSGRQSDGYRKPIDRVSKHNSNSNSNSNSSPSRLQNQTAIDEPIGERAEKSADVTADAFPIPAHRLAMFANAAATERWGEQPCPFTANGHASTLSVALSENGVDEEVARLSFYRQCRGLTTAEPPRTIKYFLPGILDDWNIEIARRQLAHSGEKPPAHAVDSRSNRAGIPGRNGASKPVPQAMTYPAATDSDEKTKWQS